jgi:glycine oxidase
LLRQTGVDNGFRRCGAIYLAVDDDSQRDLAAKQEDWRRQGIVAEPLSPAALIALEPSLAGSAALQRLRAACFVPEEAQIRNPRHLRALCAACALRGVSVEAFIRCDGFDLDGNRVRAARTSAGPLAADSFCIAGGAWSGAIAGSLGLALAVKPIRGQIVLFRCPRPLLSRIINIGRRYLVPRDDGRVLVGSTEEDVGFNCGTTDEAIQELTEVAFRVAPALARVPVERSWAGLRPASPDGLPYIGRVPPLANLYVAAGHYRGGLQLSTGTAVLVSAMLRGQEPPIDPIPFAVDRAGDPRPDA